MPSRVVEKNVAGLLPTGTLSVELSNELPEEHSHDVSICVGLCERAPDVTFSVQGRQQGDPRRHLLDGDGSGSVGGDPGPANETGLVEPRLVDIDDAPLRVEERQ